MRSTAIGSGIDHATKPVLSLLYVVSLFYQDGFSNVTHAQETLHRFAERNINAASLLQLQAVDDVQQPRVVSGDTRSLCAWENPVSPRPSR